MYLNEKAKKQSEVCFTYNLTRGIEGLPGKMGKIIKAQNISSMKAPFISPVAKFYRREYPNNAISVGSYLENVYYNTSDGFYFNGERKGDLTDGKKSFINFSGKVYIFPDRACYDIENDVFENVYRSITAKIKVHIRAGYKEFTAVTMGTGGINLAEFLKDSHSIELSGTYKGAFDGCFKINSYDLKKGEVYFGHFSIEFDTVSDNVITLTNAIPELEGACVCKNRILGYKGNKIYGSAFGDAMSWCNFDDDNGSYRYENAGGDDFTACDNIDDQFVLFTADKAFKIYGDDVRDFSLRMASGYGGIGVGFENAHARVLGDIYYIQRNSIVKFTGSVSEVVCRLPDTEILSAFCFPYYNKLYFCYRTESGEHTCVFDVDTGAVYSLGIEGALGFINLNDNLCVVTDKEIVAIEGKGERLPSDFNRDGEILSSVEFSEIHNGWDRFSPSKLYIRGDIMPDGELDIYCMLGNSGEWNEVYKITKEGQRLWEFSLPASLTDSFRLKLEGKGSYVIGNIYVLFS